MYILWRHVFLSDIFGNSDDIIRYTDETLAAVSSAAREDYGEAYISSLPASLSRMSQQCAEDVSPVVDDMCHALLAARPEPVYSPGRMARLLPLLQRCCPTAAFDAILALVPRPTDLEPAGLSRSWGSWEVFTNIKLTFKISDNCDVRKTVCATRQTIKIKHHEKDRSEFKVSVWCYLCVCLLLRQPHVTKVHSCLYSKYEASLA